MKYHTSTTQFNCGIDLHARQMYVCVMDRDGKKLVHTNVKNNDFDFFLKLVGPYRQSLTVCAECMGGWYWLADACQEAKLPFVLAHALYLRAIHGGKNKNDRIDSEKIAHLLRSNLIPSAYVYPADQRPLRALLRQRLHFVWNRSELQARIQSHQLAHNRRSLPSANRDHWEEQLLVQETHPVRQLALQNELALIGHYDTQISLLESQLKKLTRAHLHRDYSLLQTVPGIGEHLGLTILYEVGDIARFPTVKDFLSYCRLVKGTVASAGKIKGLRGAKLGNPYLRWAFGQAAIIAKRDPATLGPLYLRLEARMKGNKFKANTVLAIKLARAVYYMLKNHTVFDPQRLVAALANDRISTLRAERPQCLTGSDSKPCPYEPQTYSLAPGAPRVCVGQARNPSR